MIPKSLDSSADVLLLGAIVLLVGCLVAATGFVISSRNLERERDRHYLRRKRGEELVPVEPPKLARVLEYAGGAIAVAGIVILVAGWTLTPGQS